MGGDLGFRVYGGFSMMYYMVFEFRIQDFQFRIWCLEFVLGRDGGS